MNIGDLRPVDFMPSTNFTPQMPESNLDHDLVNAGTSVSTAPVEPNRVEYLNNLVSEINNFTLPGRRLDIEVHEGTGRLLVSVYDSNTGDLVREVPSRAELDLAYLIRQHTGAMFDINI